MNILPWIVQSLLAVHTLIGAVWKLSNPAQILPSLQAIPAGAWLVLSLAEVGLSVALVVPAFNRSLAPTAPLAALVIAAEMLLFVTLNLQTPHPVPGETLYWLAVTGVCAFIVYGRVLRRAV